MSLQTRLTDLVVAVATDYKQLRVWTTGSSTGDLNGLTTTAKTSLLAAINELAARPASTGEASGPATETVSGIAELATQTETNTGTDDSRIVTPLKFQTRLAAYAQPLSENLTAIAAVVSGAFGRTLLGATDAPSARTALGLASIATTGSASDLTTGTLSSALLPPLAINETFVVASEAAQLALTAQRGDIAKRTDIARVYVLATDAPGVLANWVDITTSGDVLSVAGRTGVVNLTKADVGLTNVDNTSDADKPVSTAQQEALNLRLLKSANLSDVVNAATALGNLGGVSSASIGDPDVDLVSAYSAAKA